MNRVIAPQSLVIGSNKKIGTTPSKNISARNTLKSPLSSLPNKISDIEKSNKELNDKIAWSEIFDNMMESCLRLPQHIAFEKHMILFFHSNRAIFWEKRPNSNTFLSRTLKSEVSTSCSLIQQIIDSSKPIVPNLIYDPDIILTFSLQSFDHQFFVPLRYPDGTICAIVQISRHQNCSPFNQDDFKVANFVMKKFILYGSPFFQKERIVGLASKVSQIGPLSQTADQIKKVLQTTFHCNSPDIWFLQLNDGGYHRFDSHLHEFIGVYKCSIGVVGLILQNNNHNTTISSQKVGDLKHFSSSIDGDSNDPILMSSCEFEGRVWCVALRGERSFGVYANDDQYRLSTIIPFIARSLSFSGGFLRQNVNSEKKSEASKINLINIVSSLTESLDVSELIELVQEEATNALKVEICRVLIVDSKMKELKSDFSNGIDDYKKNPFDRGFAGSTVMNHEPIICSNPEEDSRFDRKVDVGGSTKVRNILSVPVFDDENNESVSSVLVVLNKTDGEFTESDKMRLTTIAKFFGIAFKNAERFRSTFHIFSQMKDFIKNSSLSNKSAKENIEDVLNRIKEVINASRLTLFIVQKSNSSLHEFITIGKKLDNEGQYAIVSLESRQSSFYSIIQEDKSIICCVPFMGIEDAILGVIEVVCNSSEFNEEMNLLESFIGLASSSLDKSYLDELSNYEDEKSKYKEIIGEESIGDYDTPKMLITSYESNIIFNPSFIVQGNTEIELTKIVFKCFDKFNLKQEFKLSSQKLFSFITNISKTYKDVPYHDWSHAVSTCLFCAILLMKTKLDEKFNKIEILSIFIASLGHDSGDANNFLDELYEKEETPLIVLYKNQSVNEMNQCKKLIDILKMESCNLLSSIDGISLKSAWELIIYLILQTDITKHFEIMNEYEKVHKDNSFSLENHEHRKLQLALFLKCADLSECVKKFEFADSLSNHVCEEFFKYGPIENVGGIQYINEDHKRKSLDKEKSLLGFFKFVTFPLFEKVCEYNENLQDIKDYFVSNLEKWSAKYEGEEEKNDEANEQESEQKEET